MLWLTYTFVYTPALSNTPVTYSIISYNSHRESVRLTGTKRMTTFSITAGCRMFPGSALKLQHKLHSAREIAKYPVSNAIITTTKQLKMQRLNSRSFSKKSQLPQTAPDTLYAPCNAFFPARVPCYPASGMLEAAAAASSGLCQRVVPPVLFRRFCLDNSPYLTYFNCRPGRGTVYEAWHFFTKFAFRRR